MESEELDNTLNALEETLASVRQINNLGLDPTSFYRNSIKLMHDIGQTAITAANNLAITGVQRGEISRRAAGRILGVHENTVARWVKDSRQPSYDND